MPLSSFLVVFRWAIVADLSCHDPYVRGCLLEHGKEVTWNTRAQGIFTDRSRKIVEEHKTVAIRE
jgi:hypothetical protein